MVDLDAGPQRLGEGGRTDGSDHELLDVHIGIGVGAAVEDVHHRHRQQVGVGSAQVLVQRQIGGIGGSLGHSQRDSEDGVGAEAGLVLSPVQVQQHLVDDALLGGVEGFQCGGDDLVDGLHRLRHPLAEVPALIAVTALHGFEGPGGGA